MAVLLLIIAFSVDFRAPAPVRRSCGRQANADWANPWSMVKRDPIQVSLLRLFSITFHAFEKNIHPCRFAAFDPRSASNVKTRASPTPPFG
jgi:hypothetical protein